MTFIPFRDGGGGYASGMAEGTVPDRVESNLIWTSLTQDGRYGREWRGHARWRIHPAVGGGPAHRGEQRTSTSDPPPVMSA